MRKYKQNVENVGGQHDERKITNAMIERMNRRMRVVATKEKGQNEGEI